MRRTPIDRYLRQKPPATRKVLAQVRDAISHAIPEATEVLSYQMPAYRLPEGMVLYFAGFTAHYSVYPVTAGVARVMGARLAKHRHGRGTLRFSFDDKVPVALIGRIAKVRAFETKERAAARKAKRRTVARAGGQKSKPRR